MNNESPSKDNLIVKIFNYIGGTLIFLGIAYFVFDNWGILNSFTRIFATLGVAIAALCVAGLLQQTHKYEAASAAFFMIAGLILPIGLQVTVDVFDLTWSIPIMNLVITGVSLIIFLVTQYIWQRAVTLLFVILFATGFYFSLIDYILSHAHFIFSNIMNYECMALGASYLFLGYYLDKKYQHALVGPLYFFGALLVLFSSFDLGSTFITEIGSLPWRIITAILIILSFILSVPLRSKSLLYLGAVFLILYICDISSTFIRIFGTLGWPVILISMGILLMLIGYGVIFLHKRINRIKLD